MNSNLKSFWSLIIPLWAVVAFLGILFVTRESAIERIAIVFALFVLNAAMHFKGCNTVIRGEEPAAEKVLILRTGSWGCDMMTGTIFLVSALIAHFFG